jgi:hypothetical protein
VGLEAAVLRVCAESTDTTGRCRFYVKAAGEWTAAPIVSGAAEEERNSPLNELGKSTATPSAAFNQKLPLPIKDVAWNAADILAYKPTIKSGEWILSEIDVEWMATGCYILGCGGGGSPESKFLAVREIIREGGTVRVIDLSAMEPNGVLIWGGGIGSPEVSAERLVNEE